MKLRLACITVLFFTLYTLIATGEETTNSIPQNLFLTDDGHVFWHKPSGETVVAKQKIKEAQGSAESRPADQDPEGHWGKVTDGLQLSIRIEKKTYAVGEHLVAILLLRNISDKPLKYLRLYISNQPSPINVLAEKDQKPFQPKDTTEPVSVGAVTYLTVLPNTQHRYLVELDKYYDLGQIGEYSFKASYKGPKPGGNMDITSETVNVTITNVSNTVIGH